jgi:hypothetical protein
MRRIDYSVLEKLEEQSKERILGILEPLSQEMFKQNEPEIQARLTDISKSERSFVLQLFKGYHLDIPSGATDCGLSNLGALSQQLHFSHRGLLYYFTLPG